jgi:cytochrome c oxidase cbb3-type subunit III
MKYTSIAKRFLFTLIAVIASVASFAQDATSATPAKSFWDDPLNHPMFSFYMVATLLFVVFILVIVVSVILVRTIQFLIEQMERQRAEAAGRVYVPSPSWWDKLMQQLNASVPVAEEKNIELDHNYDGIKELDNHLPPWWKWLFYFTIVWSVVYIFVYHFSNSLPLSKEEYENEVTSAAAAQQKFLASQPKAAIDVTTLEYKADAAIIANGKSLFTKNVCASCHRADGGGNAIGPNITDEYWLHGGGIKNVFNTINNGVVEKGMPAWGKTMSQTDVRDLAFFVMSLQGTKPANAKASQGELYKPETKEAKSDSTKVKASM